MKLHWRIGALLLPMVLVGLAILGFGAVAFNRQERALQRIDATNHKLDTIQTLGGATGRYATRVAQVLLAGREQQDELRAARLDMERGFARLAQGARDEASTATGGAETSDAITDVENARRMLELYHAIDLAAARAFVLDRDGHRDQAMEVYQHEVDFRLTTEFAALLDDAIAGEKRRLIAERLALDEFDSSAQLIGAALGLALVLAMLVSWLLLSRRAEATRPEVIAAFETHAEELRAANQRLRDTDVRRAQFLADVSHELRTPLTILRGEADVALLPNSNPQDQRRSLERIQDQADELGQLLDDLIAFARSDGESQPLVPGRILLDDVLATAVEEGQTLAEPREVTVTLVLNDKNIWIDADMRRLKQALIIGIDNAINHSPPGSAIAVELSRTADQARTRILDHGPGLSADDEHHVFDRFYRGANGSNAFGLGIGLAIAKGIVEQHNGTISLANRPEGGAVLTIDLPLPEDARP
jgi:two-component system OmpR family sensor kinase